MFLSSGIGCLHALGCWPSSAVHHPGAKNGTTMQLVVVAIVVIVGFGLYRFLRARNAH